MTGSVAEGDFQAEVGTHPKNNNKKKRDPPVAAVRDRTHGSEARSTNFSPYNLVLQLARYGSSRCRKLPKCICLKIGILIRSNAADLSMNLDKPLSVCLPVQMASRGARRLFQRLQVLAALHSQEFCTHAAYDRSVPAVISLRTFTAASGAHKASFYTALCLQSALRIWDCTDLAPSSRQRI